MTTTQTAALVVVAVAAGLLLFLFKKLQTEEATSTNIQLGPIRHERLAPELDERIKTFQPVFEDIYPQTLEQWVEGFQRDVHPESEIAIWEAIASALTSFAEDRDLDLASRREAFVLLLDRSSRSAEDALARAQLKTLTLEDAQVLLALYSTPPNPVTYERQ